MAVDRSNESKLWPTPKFYFEVDFGAEIKGVPFQEVSGLDQEVQPIEYRAGNSAAFSAIKMPGIVKFGNVTMKRGIFVDDHKFRELIAELKMNTVKRRTVLIKLLDGGGKLTMQWQLNSAWPTKISAADVNSNGNDAAVDTMEISYEKLVVANG